MRWWWRGTPQIKEFVDGPGEYPRIMLKRDVVLPARCQADLTAQVVCQRPTKPSEGTWSTTVGDIHLGVMVARTLVPDLGRNLRVRVLNLTETPLRLVAGQDLRALKCIFSFT